jgi:hypothetical protein
MSTNGKCSTVVLTAKQLEAIDAEAKRLEAEHRMRVSRSAIVRRLVDDGLARLPGGGNSER